MKSLESKVLSQTRSFSDLELKTFDSKLSVNGLRDLRVFCAVSVVKNQPQNTRRRHSAVRSFLVSILFTSSSNRALTSYHPRTLLIALNASPAVWSTKMVVLKSDVVIFFMIFYFLNFMCISSYRHRAILLCSNGCIPHYFLQKPA